MALESMDWTHLAQSRDRWRALVNTVMKVHIPYRVTGLFMGLLFYDAFSVTRLYSVDNKVISEWQWIGKDLVGSGHCLFLRYYPGIRLEGLRKATETSIRIAGWRGLCWLVVWVYTNVSEDHAATQPWRWRQLGPPKRLHTFTRSNTPGRRSSLVPLFLAWCWLDYGYWNMLYQLQLHSATCSNWMLLVML
jgi:hypothetical protein